MVAPKVFNSKATATIMKPWILIILALLVVLLLGNLGSQIILTRSQVTSMNHKLTTMQEDQRHIQNHQSKLQKMLRAGNNNKNNSTSLASALPTGTSLLERAAPMIFPMDPDTGKIDFPDEVDTIIIDIGAREPSHFLNVVTALKDPSIGLIMFDPMYDSFVPIAKRAMEYTMQQSNPKGDYIESPTTVKRVMAVNAAIGPQEQTVEFHLSASAHCGSILSRFVDNPNQPGEDGGCPHKKKGSSTAQAMVLRLRDVLKLLPEEPQLHIKIDAEGVDIEIVKDTREAFERATTVIMECDSTVQPEMKEIMCRDAQMCGFHYDGGNMIVWNEHKANVVPEYLISGMEKYSSGTDLQDLYRKVPRK